MEFKLTPSDVAKRLKTKKENVKKWIEDGNLKAIRMPTEAYDCFRISEQWYNEFITSIETRHDPLMELPSLDDFDINETN